MSARRSLAPGNRRWMNLQMAANSPTAPAHPEHRHESHEPAVSRRPGGGPHSAHRRVALQHFRNRVAMERSVLASMIYICHTSP